MSAQTILISASKGQTNIEDIHNAICGLDDEDQSIPADITLIKVMADLEKHNYEEYVFKGCSWRWHWAEIIRGEYPLEKLPDHVRDLAQVLYYQNVGQKTSKTG